MSLELAQKIQSIGAHGLTAKSGRTGADASADVVPGLVGVGESWYKMLPCCPVPMLSRKDD